MRPHLPIPSPPQLAEVHTPTGAIWYVPRARQHESFLVQRRYVNAGFNFYIAEEERLYQQYERAAPVLIPYLNPGAVQAAGLDTATIMAWSVQHPEQIFSHPTYGPLCLRWGDNAHGYTVKAQAAEVVPAENVVRVTPYTCWLTGTTYYQIDTDSVETSLFATLVAQAGMLLHEQEVGLEGTWSGWCLTTLDAATTILAAAGYQLRLACSPLYYGVWLYPDAPGVVHWITISTKAEEALAFYQRLPEVSSPAQSGSTAMWGHTLGHPDQEPEWYATEEKQIPFEYGVKLWQQQVIPYPNAVVTRQLYGHELALDEAPLRKRIPTLREFISAGRFSRWQLSQQLEWLPEKLTYMEHHPWELTFVEVRKLANLLEVAEEQIVESLWHELQAWEALKQKKVAKAVSNHS